ncbi:MAG: hypothetical protein KJ645_03305 [Planctomycetes bacterium]|nr:hypothetical protein [Planctomycetota bacterium]
MEMKPIRLSALSLSLRLATTCLIVVLAGGLAASVFQMMHHYENKDEQPGLTMDDIIGSFHGMNQPARLAVAIDGLMRAYIPAEEEYTALRTWLSGNRISEDYDSLELGDYAPAEIIAMNCLTCHGRDAVDGGGINQHVPLDYWDDVKKVAFPKNLDPVPLSIMATSTHTHALTMPLVGLVAALLFLATGWSKGLRHCLVMLAAVALLVDLSSWWLARFSEPFCYLIVLGGGIFGGLCGLMLLAAFIDTWFGKKPNVG